MTKRSPTEVWADLSGKSASDAPDADMDAVLAMTPEERRRELEKAGFNLERIHAEAEARSDPPAKPATLRPRRVGRFAFAAAAAVAVATGAAAVVNVLPSGDVVGSAPADPRAAALRAQASDACAARDWKTCIAKLDEAKTLDPAGDDAGEVQALRRSAKEGATGP